MQTAQPWYEQDTFWDATAPIMFGQRRLAEAPTMVEQLLALANIQSGADILDLCCGIGRHALELARRGFHVTGVDRTQRYLDRAAEQAEAEGLRVDFIREDMRSFCRLNAFDVVINLFTSFGYFENVDDDRQVMTNVHRSLKQDGMFVLETMGKEVLARIFRERDWREDAENGYLILEERKVSQNWGWIENRWILFKGTQRAEFTLGHRLYSAAELTSLLHRCGFGRVEAYGDLEGHPYDHTAKRLVIVARKP